MKTTKLASFLLLPSENTLEKRRQDLLNELDNCNKSMIELLELSMTNSGQKMEYIEKIYYILEKLVVIRFILKYMK